MNNNSNNNAVVVFSGGQDSTTCLFWALERFDKVIAVTFNYNQKHKLEIECAQNIAKELGVEHHILDMDLLNQLAPNALTRDDIKIEEGKDGELPSTFVEGRNMVFLTFAAILAKTKNARHIVTGVCETDFSGYPDCRDVFVKSLNVTANLAMDYDFVMHTPLMWLDKAQTWELADKYGKLEYVREKTSQHRRAAQPVRGRGRTGPGDPSGKHHRSHRPAVHRAEKGRGLCPGRRVHEFAQRLHRTVLPGTGGLHAPGRVHLCHPDGPRGRQGYGLLPLRRLGGEVLPAGPVCRDLR